MARSRILKGLVLAVGVPALLLGSVHAVLEGPIPLPEDALPDGLKMSTRFRDRGSPAFEILTVREKLRRLEASFYNGKFYDRGGREIFFFRLPYDHAGGIGGAVARREQERIAELQRTYTVVLIYPYGIPDAN
jgi:hypothetical protein